MKYIHLSKYGSICRVWCKSSYFDNKLILVINLLTTCNIILGYLLNII